VLQPINFGPWICQIKSFACHEIWVVHHCSSLTLKYRKPIFIILYLVSYNHSFLSFGLSPPSRSLSISFFLYLYLLSNSLSLSFFLSLLSLSLTLTHTSSFSLSISFSLFHTHIHTHTHSLSFALSLSLLLTHTHSFGPPNFKTCFNPVWDQIQSKHKN